MDTARASGIRVALCVLLFAVSAFSYLVDNGVHAPPPDYLSPAGLPPHGSRYIDAVFNSGGPPDWIFRLTDAANTPRIDGIPGNVPWITHEYSTMSAFNADNSLLLLFHSAYSALYDANGNLIRNLLPICPTCAPRWSRVHRDVLYYVKGKQMYTYNATTDVHAPLGAPLPYDQVITKGEDDICFDGDHLIGFGRRADVYYMYVFSVNLGVVISEALIGNASAFANIDSAEIAPDDIVIVSYLANDTQNTKSPNKGIWAFTINLTPLWQVSSASGHHDIGRDNDGMPILVMTNSASYNPLPRCANGIEKISILDPKTRICLMPLHWTLAVHVSLPDQKGWALVSTYAPGDPWYGSFSRKEELTWRLGFSGAAWNLDTNDQHSGGKARWSDNDPAVMNYVFYGTEVRWIAYKDSSSGIANITVDGQTASVDLYSETPVAQTEVYRRENLPPGFHSVRIDVTNQKNPLSSGYKVWVDAIDDNPPWPAYTNEIVMVRLDGGEVRRLTHHRSRPFNSYTYQPRPSVSRDGRQFVFDSNYGLPSAAHTNYSDVYVMTLSRPSAAMPIGATQKKPAKSQPLFIAESLGGLRQRPFIAEYLYPRSER